MLPTPTSSLRPSTWAAFESVTLASRVPFTLAVTLLPTTFRRTRFGLLTPLIARFRPSAGKPPPPPDGERTSSNLCRLGKMRSS